MQIHSTPDFNGLELLDSRIETVTNSGSVYTDQGRFSFTDDTKKLYVGNGSTAELLGTSLVLVDGLIDGTIIDIQEYYIDDNGTNIYAIVGKEGGGNIRVQFGETVYTINATTVTDTEVLGNNKARVVLTAGANAYTPVKNYVYIIYNGGNPILQASTSEPTGEYAYVGTCLIPDLTTFQSVGSYTMQRYNNSIKHDGKGRVHYIDDKLRSLGATYNSGVAITGDSGASPLGFSTTAGIVYQLHQQTFPALNVLTDGIYIANHPTTPYIKITDLASATARITATGTPIANGDRFSYVIWGSVSSVTGECKLYLNLPNGVYTTDIEGYYDTAGKAATDVPPDFQRTAFLIARLPYKYTSTGATYTYITQNGGADIIDLRGSAIGSITGGSSGAPINSAYTDYTTGLANPTQVEGRTFWEDTDKALSYWTDVTGTSIQMGQEMIVRFYNNTGVQINNGAVLYFNQTVTGGVPNASLAKADSYLTCQNIAIATSDVAHTGQGFATRFGKVREVNTSSYAVGTLLYLSPTVAGGWTSTKPTDPNYILGFAYVLVQNATTGVLLVNATGAKIRSDITGIDWCDPMLVYTALTASTFRVDDVNWSDKKGALLKVNTNERPTNRIKSIDTITSPGDSILTVTGESLPGTINFIKCNFSGDKSVNKTANYWYSSFNTVSNDVLNEDINRNPIVYYGEPGRIIDITTFCSDLGTNTNGATFNATVNGGADIFSSDISLVSGSVDSGVLLVSGSNEVNFGDSIRITNPTASGFDDISDGYISVTIAKY